MTIETPENLIPYVEALGEEMTIKFLLRFGGSPLYLAANPSSANDVAALVGPDAAKALAKIIGPGQIGRVPIAREWTVRQLKARKWSNIAIARELKITDETVRKLLKRLDDRQISFQF